MPDRAHLPLTEDTAVAEDAVLALEAVRTGEDVLECVKAALPGKGPRTSRQDSCAAAAGGCTAADPPLLLPLLVLRVLFCKRYQCTLRLRRFVALP